MDEYQKEIIKILIKEGKTILERPREEIDLPYYPEIEELITDLNENSHLFVLFCIMQRRITAKRAAKIPYLVSMEIGSNKFSDLLKIKLKEVKEIFNRKNLHLYNNKMAENFYYALQKIHNDYDDQAFKIWINNPKSATVVRRFLGFKGVGLKIANMAANMLVRDFNIPMKDYNSIDISVDTHIRRLFKRLGFVNENANDYEIIYTAKEFYPEYPGIFDLPCWNLGTTFCKPKNPECESCYLNMYCPKLY